MKILIGSIESAGIIRTLASAYRTFGHDVTTISSPAKFYSEPYDIDPNKFIHDVLKKEIKNIWIRRILFSMISLIPNFLHEKVKSIFIRRLLLNHDIFISIYNTVLWDEERILRYLKQKNKKIITLFLGSDIRDYNEFKEKYNITNWNFSHEINLPGKDAKLWKLRLHEKYSDAIFSVPDQSINANRPYFHLQVPMIVSKFKFFLPQNNPPKIIHAPSKPELKGTDLIIKTLDELKEEGLQFEFKTLVNLPHEKLLYELSNADILIDEIVLHGPGFLSFEAMLSGCAVATKYLENSPNCFTPPVFNINEYNIKERLRILINDPALIIKLAQNGRDYALKHNNHFKVAEDILNSINNKNFDYLIE